MGTRILFTPYAIVLARADVFSEPAGKMPEDTMRLTVAKPDLGTKRICPETGRKFYDLNKDPIVSPYTGESYPRSYFDSGSVIEEEEEVEEQEEEVVESDADIVSLEDADEEAKGSDSSDDDDDDVELDSEEDDTFLADDEDEDDDGLDDIIGVGDDDDEN